MMQEFERCEHCGHLITGPRIISLYMGLVVALFDVFKWCEEKEVHEFEMAQVKHLLGKNEYARFSDLALFGMVYKRAKGSYGLPIARLGGFFAGLDSMPIELEKEPKTGFLTQKRWAKINEIPSLVNFLDQNWQYVARYKKPEPRTPAAQEALPF